MRHSLSVSVALFAALVTAGARAHAEDRPEDGVEIPIKPDENTEVTVIPLAGGDSDIGIGGGYLASVAHLKKDYLPYTWKVESVGLITFKGSPSGKLEVPFQDYYVNLTVPHLIKDRLRFELRPSFNWLSTINYFGLGNNSNVGTSAGNPGYYQFARINPTLRASVRVKVGKGVYLLAGNAYSQNWLDIPAQSKVAYDMANGSATVKSILGDTRPHGVLQFQYGLIWDRRDNETSTKSGMYHQATVTLAPGGAGDVFPHQWAITNVTTRFFVPLGTPRLVFAARGVVDLLFGDAPFYELARFEDTNAIGGVNGVRGVPAQRYYGKAKVFGNLELRTELFDFRFSGKPYKFGVVGFFDGGRVWTEYKSHPELDGTGIGLKYGVGGGLRLQAGESVVIRADVAWSPDATPIGAYFGAGQMF